MKKILTTILTIGLLSLGTAFAETVVYNPSSGVYHKPNCVHAIRCKSCTKIDKQQAKNKGGKPCKTCGG